MPQTQKSHEIRYDRNGEIRQAVKNEDIPVKFHENNVPVNEILLFLPSGSPIPGIYFLPNF